MTGIKIVDRDTRGARRRAKLWECFGKLNLNPTDIKDAQYGGAYYAILPANQTEKALTTEAKAEFNKYNFEIIPPIEYNAMKSIVVRHLDRVINEYDDDEIII